MQVIRVPIWRLCPNGRILVSIESCQRRGGPKGYRRKEQILFWGTIENELDLLDLKPPKM